MKPAHMLVLVSCVVLACGGGCFDSHCTPPPAPAAVPPAEPQTLVESPDVESPHAQAPATVAQPAVAQAPAGTR